MSSARTPALAVLVVIAALASGGCTSDAGSQPTGGSGGTGSGTGAGAGACTGPATVSDATGLRDALDAAAAGDVIVLADGDYRGTFEATAAGLGNRPITVCGSRRARLVGPATDTGYTLHLDGASYWKLQGFSVTGGQKGVVLDDASHNELGDLQVTDVGDEAVHLRAGSSDNLVTGLVVRRTGLYQPEYGEGIYVGTATSNWCEVSHCRPDRSDDNRIVDNDVRDTTAEAVDVKEGTTGGQLRGNVLRGGDGTVDSVVDLKGNDWVVTGNQVQSAGAAGIQVHVVAAGWGRDNRIEDNGFVMSSGEYAVEVVGAAQTAGNVVGCAQEVRPAGGAEVSNVRCR